MENKDFIARLEKIGITVKSHSSSLEDSDVEKIKEAFLAGESRQIVEERIKSTVIRRRAIRAPLEEAPTVEEEEHETEDLLKKQGDESLSKPEEKTGKDKKELLVKAPITPAPSTLATPTKKVAKSEEEAKEKPVLSLYLELKNGDKRDEYQLAATIHEQEYQDKEPAYVQ